MNPSYSDQNVRRPVSHRIPRAISLPTLMLTLSVALLQVGGCATMRLPTFVKEKHVFADAKNPVTQAVCIWQPAEGRGLDELPGRGFAGQIVFLTGTSPTPVEVEGDVTIYLFDDQGTPEQRGQPLYEFHFVDGSWQTHMIPTAWGPTYQLFIPYVRKGLHRARCSVVVQIDTSYGRRVTSDMANIVLPGSEPPGDGTTTRYAPQHSRLPAGRVIAGDASHVVATSARAPLQSVPAGTNPVGDQAPKFESFSIPYDFRQANAP